jgi:ferritin
MEIVTEFEKDEDIIETVTELEELIEMYLEDEEFLERESAVAVKVHELLDKLSKSKHVQKSLLLKIKILVNDISKNRVRVREIVRRFNRAGDDSKSRLWIIEQLAKEELLSEQQYFKLAEIIDEIDIKQLTDVIRETKIGQGMNFLPRKTGDLIDSLREWMQEFVEKGGTVLQNKISSVLNELLQRKTISDKRYNELNEEINKL